MGCRAGPTATPLPYAHRYPSRASRAGQSTELRAWRLLLRIHLDAFLHFLLELEDQLLALLERTNLLLQRVEALLFCLVVLHLSFPLIVPRLTVLDHRHLTQGKRGSAASRRLQGVQQVARTSSSSSSTPASGSKRLPCPRPCLLRPSGRAVFRMTPFFKPSPFWFLYF